MRGPGRGRKAPVSAPGTREARPHCTGPGAGAGLTCEPLVSAALLRPQAPRTRGSLLRGLKPSSVSGAPSDTLNCLGDTPGGLSAPAPLVHECISAAARAERALWPRRPGSVCMCVCVRAHVCMHAHTGRSAEEVGCLPPHPASPKQASYNLGSQTHSQFLSMRARPEHRAGETRSAGGFGLLRPRAAGVGEGGASWRSHPRAGQSAPWLQAEEPPPQATCPPSTALAALPEAADRGEGKHSFRAPQCFRQPPPHPTPLLQQS